MSQSGDQASVNRGSVMEQLQNAINTVSNIPPLHLPPVRIAVPPNASFDVREPVDNIKEYHLNLRKAVVVGLEALVAIEVARAEGEARPRRDAGAQGDGEEGGAEGDDIVETLVFMEEVHNFWSGIKEKIIRALEGVRQ